MKLGDLVAVCYFDQVEYINPEMNDFIEHWVGPFHGVIFETPSMGPNCVWKMWCIERGAVHILSPSNDRIKVINEVDTSNRHR